jgi:hypothetical protein
VCRDIRGESGLEDVYKKSHCQFGEEVAHLPQLIYIGFITITCWLAGWLALSLDLVLVSSKTPRTLSFNIVGGIVLDEE